MTPEFQEQIRQMITPDGQDPMHGWCWLEKAVAMADLILETKARCVVEIGVFGGRSLVPQAMALKANGDGGVIYGIDPWRSQPCLDGHNDDANNDWWAKVPWNDVYLSCVAAMARGGVEDNCVLIRADSMQAGRHWRKASIDILHVDGNHSEEASTRDVEWWVDMVKPGGYIWVDDVNWTTTCKAIAYVADRCDAVKDVSNGEQACRLYRLR